MNLLLDRKQSDAMFSLVPLRFGSGVIFRLKAELELDAEEAALIQKYRFAKAALVVSDPIDDLRQALRPALLLGFLAFIACSFLLGFWSAIPISILVTLVMTGIYFSSLREQILVSDLLDGGRIFLCDSIIALIKKEAFLEGICEYLRQVLESAKHWDEREIVAIRPLDKAAAKQAVLKGG